MSDFEKQLEEVRNADKPAFHGAIFKGVDKNGKLFYSKEVGRRALDPAAEPITGDDFLKLTSCTKLITSIALLQCVERGLIGLDDSVYKVLPELENVEIISWKDEEKEEFELRKSTNPITPRQLLTHTSGVTYDVMSPPIMAWRASRGEKGIQWGENTAESRPIPEAFGCPLIFEPGEGWTYGGSLDWAGLIVKRLNDTTLEEYFTANIFKIVGCSAPYPTFDLNKNPQAKARLVQASQRTPEGGLGEGFLPFAESPVDEQGGAGLACTANQYMAVLGDIISDVPKLLKHETVTALFTPQLIPKSPAFKSLIDSQAVYQGLTNGEISDTTLNYALGGLWFGEEMPKVGQPDGVITWGGAANLVWFASRKHGVAGFAGSQLFPPGEKSFVQVLEGWKKDLWTAWRGQSTTSQNDL